MAPLVKMGAIEKERIGSVEKKVPTDASHRRGEPRDLRDGGSSANVNETLANGFFFDKSGPDSREFAMRFKELTAYVMFLVTMPW